MSATKHTPGPWRASKSQGGYLAIYHGKAGNMIAQLGTLTGVDERATLMTLGNAKANASLIAAAPELLEALESLAERIDGYSHDPDIDAGTTSALGRIADEARAAITKATQP